MKTENGLRRIGCGCQCLVGRECCVECEEIRQTKGLAGDELWEAHLMLREGVRV